MGNKHLTNEEIETRSTEILESFNDIDMAVDVMNILYDILTETYGMAIDNHSYTNRQAVESFREWADIVADGIANHKLGETIEHWESIEKDEDR